MASGVSVKHFKRAGDIVVKVFVKLYRVLFEMSTKTHPCS